MVYSAILTPSGYRRVETALPVAVTMDAHERSDVSTSYCAFPDTPIDRALASAAGAAAWSVCRLQACGTALAMNDAERYEHSIQ